MAAETENKALADKLNDFLARKGAEGPCPFCGTNSWIAGEFDYPGFVLPDQQWGWHLAVYILACSNCGFVRPILRRLVDDVLPATLSTGEVD